MKAVHKRLIAVGIICILLIVAAAVTVEKPWYTAKEETEETEQDTESEVTDVSQSDAPELIFWYEDETYTDFLQKAAKDFYRDTGIAVQVEWKDTLDYTGDIYQATMENDEFPDAYLLSGEQLEEAYLYGIAADNRSTDVYQNTVARNALTASMYGDRYIGYPLSYNVCLFAFQNGYFETAPSSIQAIIDYSDENEPEENVEYLLEWDVNDAFFDFPFISNSISFEKEEAEVMAVVYDEALYEEDLAFFQEILESFSLNADTVSEASVISDFKEGTTVCALIDSDSLSKLEGYDYLLTEIPALNDSLPAYSCALTDMVIVNDFSEKSEEADAFAEYLTMTMSGELHQLSGHYPVILSEQADNTERIAYQAYENAILVPNSQNALGFWITLKETILNYF